MAGLAGIGNPVISQLPPDAAAWERALRSIYRLDTIQLPEVSAEGPSGPFFLSGDLTPRAFAERRIARDPRRIAAALLAENAGSFGIGDPAEDLRERSAERDRHDRTHIGYSLLVAGLPLEEAELHVHVEPDGRVSAFNGVLVPVTAEMRAAAAAAATRSLSAERVRQMVERDLLAAGQEPATTHVTELREVIVASAPYVVWRAEVAGNAGGWIYRLDAFTGEVLEKRSAAQPQRREPPALGGLPPSPEGGKLEENGERLRAVGIEASGNASDLTESEATEVVVLPASSKPEARDADAKPSAPQGTHGRLEPVTAAASQTLLNEGFEGVFPSGAWTVFDDNGSTGGQVYWDDTNYRAYSGSWSAWCADGGANAVPPGSNYPNNMASWMVYGPVSLSDATAASLTFRFWLRSEQGFDHFNYMASPNGSSFYGIALSGNSGGWSSRSLDLGNVPGYGSMLGDSSVWIGFIFTSDSSVVDLGAFVDDVRLDKTVNTETEGPKIGRGTGVLGNSHTHLDTYFDTFLGDEYFLDDVTRRASQNVHGHNGQMTSSASIRTQEWGAIVNTTLSDVDNVWDAADQAAGVDAHAYTAKVYDFMLAQLGANSYDRAGSALTSVTDVPALAAPLACPDNAFWDPPSNRMFYCSPSSYLPFSGALDVVGHELAHGLTEEGPGSRRDDLLYERESGALNEAFSDWLGTSAEHHQGETNWTMGEGIVVFRDLSNPPAYGDPDTYRGPHWVDVDGCTPSSSNDYCGVHTNSGVGNKMFYLLSQGTAGESGGAFNNVVVRGLGIATAIQIATDANLFYWTRTETFAGARNGMITAAATEGVNAQLQVRNAWAAVAVGNPPDVALVSVDAPSGTFSPGASLNVRSVVTNQGEATSTGYRITFYASTNTTITALDTPLGSADRGSLDPAASHDLTSTVTLPASLSAGTYYIGALLTISDGNSGNHSGFDPTAITVATQPPPVSPPTVTTNPATGIGSTGATLNAAVNPNGSSTTAAFEWGLTTAYGSTSDHGPVGSGTSAVSIGTALVNLTCGTTYHFRARATNAGGTSFGGDRSFQTTACASVRNPDTTGVFRPSTGALYLKNQNGSGFANIYLTYGLPGDYPVAGDWDGDGDETIGVYRNGVFYLRNSNTNGFADVVVAFGVAGDQPVVGDWDGDGDDTIGTYRNGAFYLRNSNTPGPPEIAFSLGVAGDVGIAGDWNGDGLVTTGVFRPSNGALYLKNSNSSGFANLVLTYGLPGDKPVTGDWNGDGVDTIGVYRNGVFYLRNANTNGFADLVFALGVAGDQPIAGDWDGLP